MENSDNMDFSEEENDLYGNMSSEQKEAGLRLVRAVKDNDSIEFENNKAGPFIPDEIGQTPLHYATENGNISVVQYLLKQFPEVHIDHTSAGGRTSLQIACCNGYLDLVKFFVEKDANVNLKDFMGYNSILWAVQKGHIDIVNFLINETDVDLSATNNWEEDVFELAQESTDDQIKELFDRLSEGF